jgi:hypothetical protein
VAVAGLLLFAACGLSEFPVGLADAAAPPPVEPPPVVPPAVTTDTAAPRPRDAGRADTRAIDAPAVDAAATPTPPPAGGVVIGGMALPREKVIVFLHLGHSNMAGRTNLPPEMRPLYFETHPSLWAYAKGGMWRPAKEPLSGDYLTRTGGGPGMGILHTALDLAPDKYMVSIGRGHDGSIGGWCRNFRKGALLYDFVMGPAVELKGKVTFGAIFTMLGVNEFRRDAANIPKFHECLEGIASDMRGDLGDPSIPFVMGDWEAGAKGDFDPTHDYAITTRAQIKMAAANIPRSVLIPTEGIPMFDDHHYNLTGYKMWAERGFALLKAANLLPWVSQ